LLWLDKTLSEALTLLHQVFGEDAISHLHVFDWHKRFKEGHEDLEDNQEVRDPRLSKAKKGKKIVVKNQGHADCVL